MNKRFWLALWAIVTIALGWQAGLGGIYASLIGFPALTAGILLFQWHVRHQAQYATWFGKAVLFIVGLAVFAVIAWWLRYVILAVILGLTAICVLVIIFLIVSMRNDSK